MHVYKYGNDPTLSETGVGNDELAWPFATNLRKLIWQTEAAMMLAGAAYWLKKNNRVRTVDVQWLNPFSMNVKYEKGKLSFEQNTGTESLGPWGEDRMVYFREYDPVDDVGPGVSAAAVSLEDARLLRYITRFASHYFEHGAMPVTLLGFEYAPSETEAKRVEGWFKRRAEGVKNAFRVLALRGKISPQVLTPPPKDLEMHDLANQARHSVAMAFGIPQTMLEDAANYATAGEHRMSFWQDTVRPRGLIYEAVINEQLLNPMGLRIYFNYEEMGIFQTDEARRSGAFLSLTQGGMDALSAAEILGFELTDEQRGRIEGKRLERILEGIEGANRGSRDSHGQTRMDTEGRQGKNTDGHGQARTDTEGHKGIDTEGLEEELKRWERKALKRMKTKGNGEAPFVSEVIPAGLLGAIQGALEAVRDEEGVRAVFEDARRSHGQARTDTEGVDEVDGVDMVDGDDGSHGQARTDTEEHGQVRIDTEGVD